MIADSLANIRIRNRNAGREKEVVKPLRMCPSGAGCIYDAPPCVTSQDAKRPARGVGKAGIRQPAPARDWAAKVPICWESRRLSRRALSGSPFPTWVGWAFFRWQFVDGQKRGRLDVWMTGTTGAG